VPVFPRAQSRASKVLLDQIERDRNGFEVDRAVLKSTTTMLAELGTRSLERSCHTAARLTTAVRRTRGGRAQSKTTRATCTSRTLRWRS